MQEVCCCPDKTNKRRDGEREHKIEPFEPRQLGTNSYDVRLGPYFFVPNHNMVEVNFTDEEDASAFWLGPYYAEDGLNGTVRRYDPCAHRRVVGEHNGFTTSMRSRSSIGRSCLSVCKCAGVGDVGYISEMDDGDHQPQSRYCRSGPGWFAGRPAALLRSRRACTSTMASTVPGTIGRPRTCYPDSSAITTSRTWAKNTWSGATGARVASARRGVKRNE